MLNVKINLGGLIFKDSLIISNDFVDHVGDTQYSGFLWRKKFVGSNVRNFVK